MRYQRTREINEDVPVTDARELPPFDPARLAAMGQYTDPAQANLITGGTRVHQRAELSPPRGARHGRRSTSTSGRTSHVLKAGVGYEFAEEELDRVANGWGAIADVTVSGVPALRARYYTPQPPQFGQGDTYSLFVQDASRSRTGCRSTPACCSTATRSGSAWTAAAAARRPIALKGGAAVYESDGDTCTFLRFGFGDEIQPRLGVSYQLRKGKGDKVYGDWGRYYNMDQKSSGRSLAPDPHLPDARRSSISHGTRALERAAGLDDRQADRPGHRADLHRRNRARLRDAARRRAERGRVSSCRATMHNFIEDVPSRHERHGARQRALRRRQPAVHGVCRVPRRRRPPHLPRGHRRRAAAARRAAGKATSATRGAASRATTTSTTRTAGVFNTSSFIQDGPGTNVQDPNRFGPLFEDRPHVFKVFGTYAATPRLTASGYLRVQSGTPWAARGRDWAGRHRSTIWSPPARHRNPTWANLDLMASYRLPAGGRAAVTLEARLLNVFDNQTRLSTDSQQFLDLRDEPAPPYIAALPAAEPAVRPGQRLRAAARASISAPASASSREPR